MIWRRVLAAILAVMLLSGCVSTTVEFTAPATGSGTTSTCDSVTGTGPRLDDEQNAVAKAIANTALSLGLGEKAVLIGITVAITESTLRNINYGDYSSGGVMTTSRGPFQQKDAWGTLEQRLNPAEAAKLFYTLNKGHGLRGLVNIPGWEQMPVHQAAQAVQLSGFSDGSNFRRNVAWAQEIVDGLGVSAVSCTPVGGGGGAPGTYTGPVDDVASETDPTGTGGRITKATLFAYNALQKAFPARSASCWDAHAWNPSSDHPRGRACDIYYGSAGVFQSRTEPENAARGWQAAKWLEANATALNVSYIIWDGKFWSAGQGWGPYSSSIYDVKNDPVGGHYDHIHLSIKSAKSAA